MVGALQRVEALQDVRGLPEGQPEVAPLQRNVAEANHRPSRGLLRAKPGLVHLNPRQRHARLHAALHVDERHLHVDRGGQLGLFDLELLQFDDFARFGARRSGGTVDGHGGIV